MPLSSFELQVVVITIAALLCALTCRWMRRLQERTPPGPRGWPLIGNMLEFPTQYPWIVFREWSKTYGNMIFLRLLNTRMLVISSADIALELMEKRASIYSDKPIFPMDALLGWDRNLGLMPYGHRWRSIRAHFHQYFNNVTTRNYHDAQTTGIHGFLQRSIDQGGKQVDVSNIQLTLATIILDIVYGHEVRSMDDHYLKLINKASSYFVEGKALGRFWVDFIPLLRYVPPWVPGAAAAKYGAKARPVVEEMFDKPLRDLRSNLNGNQKPSMARDLLEKLQREPDPRRRESLYEHIKDATGLAYIVGADTTLSLLQTFFCTMAMSPTIQKKAQEELEMVVGPERLPTFEDYKDLPYIRAIILECTRWLPVLPLGLAHRVTVDDHYGGYLIPKGTVIVPNVWHMLRDPQDYPDPEKYNPDRFIKDGNINHEVRDPTDLAFGFGGRICPGRHFAQDNAFLTIASVLHVFDIVPSLDENGNELDPTPHMTTGVLSYPERVNCMLKPRSEVAERLVRETASAT